jgi:hypothetical protein
MRVLKTYMKKSRHCFSFMKKNEYESSIIGDRIFTSSIIERNSLAG